MSEFSASGNISFRSPASYINSKILLAGVAERETIPPGYNVVIVTSTNNVYIKFGNSSVTATVPSDDVSDGTSSELNSNGYHLGKGFTHYSLVAPADTTVTMAYYKFGGVANVG